MIDYIASILQESGVEFEHSRASYVAIGGGLVTQERIVVYGAHSKMVISRFDGSGYIELRIVSLKELPGNLLSRLEELGAIIDSAPGEPYRLSLRLRRVDKDLVRSLAIYIGGGR